MLPCCDVTPSGYKFRHKARTGKRGGGVGILYRDNIRLEMHSATKAKSYESVHVTLTVGGSSVHIIIIYRLHPTKKSKVKSSDFFEEFATLIDELSSMSDEVIIAGDYNIHWDKPTETETKHLVELLHSANMVQHVKDRTHISGHIIDLVVTREGHDILGNVHVSSMLSDHFVVQADLRMSRPRPQEKSVSYRKYDAINMDEFSDELLKSQLLTDPSDTLDTLVDQYNDSLKCLLDKHAPMKTKTFVQRPTVPWYNLAIQAAKRDRRRLERLWSKTGLVVHQDMYKEARNRVSDLIDSAKSEYYNDKIVQCGGDQRTIFKVVDSVLHRKSVVYPLVHRIRK